MNLHDYILRFARKNLSADYSAEDVRSEVYIAILGKNQLRKYAEENAIPNGKDLSFLKSIICRTRLNIIKKENKHQSGYKHKSRTALSMECQGYY